MKKAIWIIASLLTICGSSGAIAADWYVNGSNGADSNPGTNDQPFKTIQRGIEASVNGDVVHVSAATYLENLTVAGKVISLLGDGQEQTFIDGQNLDRAVHVSAAGTLTISGFTITNGADVGSGSGIYSVDSTLFLSHCTVTGNHHINEGSGIGAYNSIVEITDSLITRNDGGGIWVSQTEGFVSNCTISFNAGSGILNGAYAWTNILNNSIHNNTARLNGGGIWMASYGTPTVEGNHIFSNTASNHGGGIYLSSYIGGQIRNNIIESNIAPAQGGGIAMWNAASYVFNNRIINNSAGTKGGGVSLNGGGVGSPRIANCIIQGNQAAEGAGVHTVMARTTVVNSTLIDNTATLQAAGIWWEPSTYEVTYEIKNTLLWNNLVGTTPADLVGFTEANVSSSDIMDGSFCGLNGNICEDPIFADAMGHISELSPCRDAGVDLSATYSGTEYDFENDPRALALGGDGAFDIGADEYVPMPSCTDTDGDGFFAERPCGSQADCDDSNPAVHPGAAEICGNSLDENCDGYADLCTIHDVAVTSLRVPKKVRTCSTRAKKIRVEVSNLGEFTERVRLQLTADGMSMDETSIYVDSGSVARVSFALQPGSLVSGVSDICVDAFTAATDANILDNQACGQVTVVACP